jgi:hypothetical protein
MQTIPLSPATHEAIKALKERYKEGKVFGEHKAVIRDLELEDIINAVIANIGIDTKKFLNIRHDVEITGDLLHNMKAIVRTCGYCVCDYTLWDSDSGSCTYLGSRSNGNCSSA